MLTRVVLRACQQERFEKFLGNRNYVPEGCRLGNQFEELSLASIKYDRVLLRCSFFQAALEKFPREQDFVLGVLPSGGVIVSPALNSHV